MNAPVMPDRRGFLGGSDAAAVMGLRPWSTPVELWLEKTGRKAHEAPTKARQRMFDRGHKLEPFIRDMVIDKLDDMGLHVELIACNERYSDPEHGFMSCEIDFELRLTGAVEIGGRLVVFDGEHVNADAKSVSGFARKKWGDENTEDVPIEYAAQFMFGLALTGRRYCLVAALRSFDDVDVYWVVRDDETIDAMKPKLAEFWIEHVLKDVPPDPLKFTDIKLLFPLDDGQPVEASDDIADKVNQLRAIKAQIKQWEDTAEVLTFEIGDFISPHALLLHQGREIASWKAQSSTRLDTAALKAEHPELYAQFQRSQTIRVLRLKKSKR